MGLALGRAPTTAEIKNIEDRIREHLLGMAQPAPARASAMSPSQRLLEAGKLAAREILIEAAKWRQRLQWRPMDYRFVNDGDAP